MTEGVQLKNLSLHKGVEKKKEKKALNGLRDNRAVHRNLRGLGINTEPASMMETREVFRTVTPWMKEDQTVEEPFEGM